MVLTAVFLVRSLHGANLTSLTWRYSILNSELEVFLPKTEYSGKDQSARSNQRELGTVQSSYTDGKFIGLVGRLVGSLLTGEQTALDV